MRALVLLEDKKLSYQEVETSSIEKEGDVLVRAKAIMMALINPSDKIREYEDKQMSFEKLTLLEEAKTKPFVAVWDYFCFKNNVPIGGSYISEIQQYEKAILSERL